jgi:hypothetical protein
MGLGLKHFKPLRNLGVKMYKPLLSHGVKSLVKYALPEYGALSQLARTATGVIYNTSNSQDAHREPMKHNSFKPKNYIKNITHSTIEKAKKVVNHGSGDRKFV